MTSTTRYPCPLDCGWHHDQPGIDLADLGKVYPLADVPVPEGANPVAYRLWAGDLLTVEEVVREHLETHLLLEWVQAVSRLTVAVQRVRETAAEWSEHCPPDNWGMAPVDMILANAGRYLIALLDQPERIPDTAADSGVDKNGPDGANPQANSIMQVDIPVDIRVTSHTYEGAPDPGHTCQAEAFGETCGALWEQHELRDEQS